jgi:pyruvate/2-oxoglutarate dehydrogenase complex dihydrolipoamide dehydrogenase (E3) component
MARVDAIVIGSGQGGVPLAAALASEGREVVLFERAALGGSCINYGCTPSKAFLASAHAAARARSAGARGIRTQVEVDFPAVMKRVRALVRDFGASVERRLTDAGVRMVRAEARFVGPRRVAGGGEETEAALVVVNTGAAPDLPPIDGLAGAPYLTYGNFWELDFLPPRTLVLGGGYVGVELGQGLARLGSAVTVADPGDSLVKREPPAVREALARALRDDGVALRFAARAREVSHEHGVFRVRFEDGGEAEAEALLIATGIRPNTAALDAQAAGIELDERGYVRVDEHLRTTAEGVYALGDVTGQPAFTHLAWEDHRRVLAALSGGQRRQLDRVLGYAFFTEPQVGRAGLTLEEALAQGRRAREVSLPLEQVARATEIGAPLGFYSMVVDEDDGRILGAALVGPEAGELIHVIIAHMESGADWRTLERSTYIHPTLAEGLTSLARQLA